MMRQAADETDGVAEQHGIAAAQVPAPRLGIERLEEPILRGDARAGQRVHQRALAGVGVTDERDVEMLVPRA